MFLPVFGPASVFTPALTNLCLLAGLMMLFFIWFKEEEEEKRPRRSRREEKGGSEEEEEGGEGRKRGGGGGRRREEERRRRREEAAVRETLVYLTRGQMGCARYKYHQWNRYKCAVIKRNVISSYHCCFLSVWYLRTSQSHWSLMHCPSPHCCYCAYGGSDDAFVSLCMQEEKGWRSLSAYIQYQGR